ncbi:unnamed protein product [Calypogeia fissa]
MKQQPVSQLDAHQTCQLDAQQTGQLDAQQFNLAMPDDGRVTEEEPIFPQRDTLNTPPSAEVDIANAPPFPCEPAWTGPKCEPCEPSPQPQQSPQPRPLPHEQPIPHAVIREIPRFSCNSGMMHCRKKWYAVAKGRQPGLYECWEEAQQQVDRFSSAKHQAFKHRHEAEQYLTFHMLGLHVE